MSTVTAPPPESTPATGSPERTGSKPNWVQRNHFLLRRLHSLSGIVPVGGYLLFHFWENSSIFYGAAAYDEMAQGARGIRFLELIEIFVIFLPLLYHAVYGLFIASYARNNTMTYNYGRNNLFMWQRVTGIITLLFILYHVWQFRFTAFRDSHAAPEVVAATMAQVPIFIFYIIGIVSASFHLGNGIWTFLITWGITVGKRAQRISQMVTTAIAILTSALGVAIALAFVVVNGGFVWP